jgi:hypothetical protein
MMVVSSAGKFTKSWSGSKDTVNYIVDRQSVGRLVAAQFCRDTGIPVGFPRVLSLEQASGVLELMAAIVRDGARLDSLSLNAVIARQLGDLLLSAFWRDFRTAGRTSWRRRAGICRSISRKCSDTCRQILEYVSICPRWRRKSASAGRCSISRSTGTSGRRPPDTCSENAWWRRAPTCWASVPDWARSVRRPGLSVSSAPVISRGSITPASVRAPGARFGRPIDRKLAKCIVSSRILLNVRYRKLQEFALRRL